MNAEQWHRFAQIGLNREKRYEVKDNDGQYELMQNFKGIFHLVKVSKLGV